MSASRIHAILSELHRLLGDYRATDFISASEYAGASPNLRDALQALARECGPQPREEGKERPSRNTAGRKRTVDQQQDAERTILNALHHSTRLRSAHSIADYAKDLGLRIAVRPKDSRDRLGRRLAQAILAQPEPRRSEIVASLARGDDQIQGWINVIKSARP
jgi:hypothetical protein